jgi:MFS family permease
LLDTHQNRLMDVAVPSRLQNLRTLRNANLDMAFSMSFITLTTGAFMVGFIQLLGGGDLWIGVLSAIPSLTGLLQIPGAIWGRSFSSYKKFVTLGGLLWRLLYIPIVALPLLPWPNEVRLTLLAILVTIASCCVTVVNPIYSDWLAEMIPSNSRGWYFSRRNAIGAVIGAVAGILGAWFLDAIRTSNPNAGFAGVFGLGCLFAGVSFVFYLRMVDLPRANPIRQNLKQGILAVGAPFGDRAFRSVLLFVAIAVLGQTFAGNLFAAFARESLKLDFRVIQGMAVTMAVGMVASAPLWGFFADKFGNKPLLSLGCFLLALNGIPWILCRPDAPLFNAVLLLSTHVLMGVTWSMISMAQFNIVLATAKPEDRANYIGAGMTVTAVIGGIAPLLGAALMAILRNGMPVEMAYKTIFAITMGIRAVSALFLIPVHEPGASGFRTTIQQLRNVTPGRLRAMREITNSGSVDRREAAIESVGRQSIGLAADEILKALHDPLPRVRRQAAATLARLRDPRAVDELVHQIEEHPDLIEEEMIEALGELGDPRACPALARLLQSPRSLLRRAAARSLGRIGAKEPALIQAASNPSDPDLRRAALQAIRLSDDRDGVPAVIAALADPHPSVRIAAAEAIVEFRIAEAAPAVRNSLEHFRDEANSELAYTLGVIGTKSDADAIADEAERSVSIITRRRCLLGLAHIWQVEQFAYRLLLTEGIARDTRLIELTRKLKNRNELLEAYSRGDERAAVRICKQVCPDLDHFPERSIDELCLVAISVAARH